MQRVVDMPQRMILEPEDDEDVSSPSGCYRAPLVVEHAGTTPLCLQDDDMWDLREECLDAAELCQYLLLHRVKLRRRLQGTKFSSGRLQEAGTTLAHLVLIAVGRIATKDPDTTRTPKVLVDWLRSEWQPMVQVAEMVSRQAYAVLDKCSPLISSDGVLLQQAMENLQKINQKLVYENDMLQRQADSHLSVEPARNSTRHSRDRNSGVGLEARYPAMSAGAIERSRLSIGQRIGQYFDDPRIGFLKGKVKAMWRLLLDPSAATLSKVMVVSALAYLVSPFDAIPDPLPVVGLSDDIAVLMATVANLGVQLAKYEEDPASNMRQSTPTLA